MDYGLGLMMTCLALFQDLESPIGHVRLFDELADDDNLRNWQQRMAKDWQVFSTAQADRTGMNIEETYRQMRNLASWNSPEMKGGNV